MTYAPHVRALCLFWAARGVPLCRIASRLTLSTSTVRRWLEPTTDDGTTRRQSRAVASRIKRRRMLTKKLASQTTKKVAWRGVHGNRDPIVVERCVFPSVALIAREMNAKYRFKTSPSTVRRDLKSQGWRARVKPRGPRRHYSDAATRKAFCDQHKDGNADDWIFSDEKWCDTNDSDRWQWVAPGSEPRQREQDRFSAKIMVWGCIGIGVKHLCFLDASVTSKTYISECLNPVNNLLQGRTFMQDNARPHIAADTVKWLAKKKIRTVAWPPRSPDLNPIETMWAWIQKEVSRQAPTDQAELRRFWREAWDRIPQSKVDALVEEFPKRCRAVSDVNGDALPRDWKKRRVE